MLDYCLYVSVKILLIILYCFFYRQLLHTAGGNVNQSISTRKSVSKSLKNLKVDLPNDQLYHFYIYWEDAESV